MDSDSAQTPPAPAGPVRDPKKDAEVERLIERKKELLEAEKERKAKRAAEQEAVEARQHAGFGELIAAEQARKERFQEWRAGQHEKRRELELERWQREQERIRQEKLKAIAAEKEAKNKEYMQEVHRVAAFKMMKQDKENAEHLEKIAQHHARDVRAAAEAQATNVYRADMSHIEGEERRLTYQLGLDREKKLRAAKEEAARAAKLAEDKRRQEEQKAARTADRVAAERLRSDARNAEQAAKRQAEARRRQVESEAEAWARAEKTRIETEPRARRDAAKRRFDAGMLAARENERKELEHAAQVRAEADALAERRYAHKKDGKV